MLTKKSPKISHKFYCETCNYKCSKQSEYNKHLSTAKHKKLTNLTNFTPKNAAPNMHICDVCNKQYKSRMGLWGHKKKCIGTSKTETTTNIVYNKTHSSTQPTDNSAMMELLKQNQEFKELLIEQQQENQELQKQLLEAVKEGKHITNNTQNNKFNLNFFLNEQCKDAINMSDFLESMTLDMEDLTETGRLGFVNGISRILVNKLRELDTYKRPLHCTDLKRETLYIRDNDVWEKEENSKQKLKELVDRVANKNCKTMKQWTEIHPNYTEMDTPENQEFMRLSDTVLGGFGEQESKQFRDRIIRSVIKEVVVNKM
jgi:hypothetical protein